MAIGYIYIMQNIEFRANLQKIGKTTRSPEERAKEISAATGVPQPYKVVYRELVLDCDRAERIVHEKLAPFRLSGNKEFFEVELEDAIEALKEAATEVGRSVEPPDELSIIEDAETDFQTPRVARKIKTTRTASRTAPVDKFGYREDKKRSEAAAMYARQRGASSTEITASLGQPHLNMLNSKIPASAAKQTEYGWRAYSVKVPGEVLRYFIVHNSDAENHAEKYSASENGTVTPM